MTTFQAAAAAYLTRIAPTHTPSTMRTYERNFTMVLTPHFGSGWGSAADHRHAAQGHRNCDHDVRLPHHRADLAGYRDELISAKWLVVTASAMERFS